VGTVEISSLRSLLRLKRIKMTMVWLNDDKDVDGVMTPSHLEMEHR